MKKKLLLTILPLITLVSCGNSNLQSVYLNEENGLPTIHMLDSEHTTYLMLSPFGNIEDYEGVSTKGKVSSLFYENTVVLKADPGVKLPDATQVKTTVEGATFRGWAYYNPDNDNVWPDYYDVVPATNGLALKAIFDGTTTSGGDSGGGGGGGSQPVAANYGIKFTNGTTVFGVKQSEKDAQGREQYLITAQKFEVGDEFSLYDSSTQGTWAIPLDGYSLGGTENNQSAWEEYLSINGKASYTVLKAFTGNLYIKLSMDAGDQLYIGF